MAKFGPKESITVSTENPIHYLSTVLIYGNVPIYRHTDIAHALAIGLGTEERFFVLKEQVQSEKTYQGIYTNFTYFVGYPDDEPVETFDKININYMHDAYPEFNWGARELTQFDLANPEWEEDPVVTLEDRTIRIVARLNEDSRVYAIATVDQFITKY